MAANFKILHEKHGKHLDLKLKGDFDGTGAFQLLDTIRNGCLEFSKVRVDTSGLTRLDPFGLETFCRNCKRLNRGMVGLLIDGRYAESFFAAWPETCQYVPKKGTLHVTTYQNNGRI